MSETAVLVQEKAAPSLISRMASRFGVEPNKMLSTLKATAFKGEVSNEQMMALLIVAEQYGLNPWTKEVYAFPDKGGIVPVVGVDGWSRILNENPAFNGVEFVDGPVNKDGVPEWIECVIFRRDREHPVKVREYMAECKRGTGPWGSHPRRMLRHKSLIQCARLAFGFTGIYDQDEAERIVEGEAELVREPAAIAAINSSVLHPTKETAPKPEPQPVLELDGNAPPMMTYAEVRQAIESAKDGDATDAAEDLIKQVANLALHAELHAIAAKKREGYEAATRG